jgi:dTDP-4-amino-4,6-dideoxygalactose transaminase
MHLQPVFHGVEVADRGVAAHLFAQGLCLPSGSGMSDAERARVIATLLSCFGSRPSA